ncbi:15033_t:CDS:2, partial [Acaulospora morrowiae]
MSKQQEKLFDKNVYREKLQHLLPSQSSEYSLQFQYSFLSVISEEHTTTSKYQRFNSCNDNQIIQKKSITQTQEEIEK